MCVYPSKHVRNKVGWGHVMDLRDGMACVLV